MTPKIPFRQMNVTLHTVQGEIALLLGVEHIHWDKADYATFIVMSNISKGMVNPSRAQFTAQLVVWLRFYKRLVDTLPDSEPLRNTALAAYFQLAAPYQHLLEVQQP